MAGAVVQSGYVVDDTGTVATTIAVTLTGVAATNLLDSHIGWGDSSLTCTCSDGTAYQVGAGPTPDASNNENAERFYLKNAGAGSHTVTGTISSSGAAFRRIRVAELSGLDTTAPLDKGAGQAQAAPGTGANAISSGATSATTNASDFVVGTTQCTTALDPGSGTLTAGAGYTISGTNVIMGLETLNVAATGAQTAQFTQSVANGRITHVVAYKQAAGGGASPTLPQLERGIRGLERGMSYRQGN